MLRCFAEAPVAALNVTLSVSLLDRNDEATASAAAASSTAAATTSVVASTPLASSAIKVMDVVMQLCQVRLMRELAYKGQILYPFIPTKQLLLLFPNSIEPTTRTSMAHGADSKISAFLSSLYRASGGVAIEIASAMLCSTSGNAALVLECGSVADALALLEACGDAECQSPEARMSSLYVDAFPCQYVPPTDLDNAEEQGSAVQEWYYIPSCLLCAERLEPSFTGVNREPDASMCSCNGPAGSSAGSLQRGCTCLQHSACRICQQLLSVQFASSSNGGSQPQVRCQECRQSGDPWICMICGYVGCSRYQAMHAKDHYVRSHHLFSINLLTQQIWDYQSDAFVHHAMFMVDAQSGKTTRLQYPGHEDATTTALLSEGEDLAAGGSAAGQLESRTTASAKDVDPVAEKKVVSGKYDAKLSTSHTQYATVIKNELDGMRSIHNENAWLSLREVDPETAMTREEVARVLEHVNIVLDHRSDKQANASSSESDSERSTVVPSPSAATAARTEQRVSPGAKRPLRRLSCGRPATEGEAMSYDALLSSLDSLQAIVASCYQEEQSIAYGIQHLTHELGWREQEGVSLEETEGALEADLRSVVRKNVMENLELDQAIEELQTTRREIDLNVSTQRQLASLMGDADSASRIVVMGRGRDAQAGRSARLDSRFKKRKS